MNVTVVFATLTGKTRLAAQVLATSFPHARAVRVDDLRAADVANADLVLVGTPTWNTGALPEAWTRALDEGATEVLEGHTLGFFGLGDSIAFPDTFGAAVAQLHDRLVSVIQKTVGPQLVIDYDNFPEAAADQLRQWAEHIRKDLLN